MSRPITEPSDSNGRSSLLVHADQVVRWVANAMLAAAAAIIVLLLVMGVAEVIARSAFNKPLMGYIDLVGLMTSAVAFLAMSFCQQSGKHIRMELLVNSLKGRAQWLAELIGILVALLLVSLLILPTWQHALRSMTLGDSTMDLNLPMWPSKLLVPVGLVVLWLRLTLNAAGYLRLAIWPALSAVAVPLPEHFAADEDQLEERGK